MRRAAFPGGAFTTTVDRVICNSMGYSKFSRCAENVKFGERLMAALNRYRNRAIESAQAIEVLIGMALELGDEILKQIAHELTDKLRNSTTVDWQKRESCVRDCAL